MGRILNRAWPQESLIDLVIPCSSKGHVRKLPFPQDPQKEYPEFLRHISEVGLKKAADVVVHQPIYR